MNSSKISIYVHIPYCRNRCSYCDFVTFEEGKILDSKDYINVLKQEIKTQAGFLKNKEVTTIYFGGGTPSLIPASQLIDALEQIQKNYTVSDKAEITIEINPGTLTDKKLKNYLAAGINRFSLGVQTFNEWFLEKSGRKHNVADSLKDLKRLQSKGLNFSLDLMFGLPHQSFADLKMDLCQALVFDPPHVSLYNLTVPAGHELAKNRGSEQEQIDMFQWIESNLKEKGLLKYEISNFGKPGFFSRHNQAYWEGKTVLSFGLSAHSYLSPHFSLPDNPYGIRFWNASNMDIYLKQAVSEKLNHPFSHLKNSQVEILNPYESLTDFCYTRLRTSKGLSLKEMQGIYPQDLCHEARQKFVDLNKKHYLTEKDSVYCLTDKGQILSNQVFLELSFTEKDFKFLNNPL